MIERVVDEKAGAGAAGITPRNLEFPFGQQIPRHWMGGGVVWTALVNGLNLVFPLGERFFVRSVRHFADQLDDPELLRKVRAFAGQEALHAREHERFIATMVAQGYRVDGFLRAYELIAFRGVERLAPRKLSLSATAACEHYTAMFAHEALSTPLLSRAHPVMRELLLWHAAEEIEHKSVAFDVLRAVDGSYALRVAGLAQATVMLTGFWFAATLMLLSQEPSLSPRRVVAELGLGVRSGRFGRGKLLRALWQYLRRDFHPSDVDDADLSLRYLDSIAQEPA